MLYYNEPETLRDLNFSSLFECYAANVPNPTNFGPKQKFFFFFLLKKHALFGSSFSLLGPVGYF